MRTQITNFFTSLLTSRNKPNDPNPNPITVRPKANTITTIPQDLQILLSNRLKDPQISITGNQATRINTTHLNHTSIAVLVNIKLDQPVKYKWSIRVIQYTGQVLFGICRLSAVTVRRFKFPQEGDVDHGHYAVECKGSAVGVGKRVKSQTFGKVGNGEVVEIMFDRSRMKVSFRSQKRDLDMEVEPPREGDQYYPCIYLGIIGDTVELLNFQIERQ